MDWIWGILFILFSLLMWMQSKKGKLVDSEQDGQNIQQSVEQFIAKIETENEALYERMVHYVKTNQQAAEKKIQLLEERISMLEEKLNSGEVQVDYMGEVPSQESLTSNQNPEEENVLQLFKQGFSRQQIAKVLQMDDGEVELILNLLKKRQSLPNEKGVLKSAN